MGDHYVIDVLAGIVYAVVTFFALERFYAWRAARREAPVHRPASSEHA
jgi:membrane-associated phospholipid phosphatase